MSSEFPDKVVADAIHTIMPFATHNPFPHGTLVYRYWDKHRTEMEAKMTEEVRLDHAATAPRLAGNMGVFRASPIRASILEGEGHETKETQP